MSSMFPYKLHEMLEYAEKGGMESIVSWLPDGRAFKVHQPEPFMKTLVPSFFKQNRYKSFQRQLHLYGFERITEGRNKGAYHHKYFLKENRYLCHGMTRVVIKSESGDAKNAAAKEDNRHRKTPSEATTEATSGSASQGGSSPRIIPEQDREVVEL